MNKKTIRIIFAVFLLSALLMLTACSPNSAVGGLDKFTDNIKAVSEKLAEQEAYAYTMTLNVQTMTNFGDSVLPSNKEPSERAKWDRPTFEYLFIKDRLDWYAKAVLTDTKKDASGQPVFSDKDFKKNLYEAPTVTEYWYVSGLLTVKKDGQTVFSGQEADYIAAAADDASFKYAYGNPAAELLTGADTDAVFYIENRKWFSQTIAAYTSFYTVDTVGARLPYQISPFVSGTSEDLQFDWERLSGVISETYSYTSKKNKPVLIEYNTEAFASNKKTATQIWNNREVTVWNGDVTEKTASVFRFSYPDKKTVVSIPKR
ncbi:MAG: hypothetical protein LBT30_07215 [Clostridiales bacterium]|jgi:hypothetical protein|nr:hypothetical protein [Clostridiales bacterium]